MEIAQRVVSAITWKIVAELCRRHYDRCQLSVLETHPGGGMYDCLSLCAGGDQNWRHLCDFNQQSRHLHLFTPYKSAPIVQLEDLRWPDGDDYVLQWLQSNDPKNVIDDIASLIGFPKSWASGLPSTSAPVLMIRVIAELCTRFAFERSGLDARNGYLDTAGMMSSQIRPELRQVAAIANEAPLDAQRAVQFVRGFWLLRRGNQEGSAPFKVIVDLRGTAYLLNGQTQRKCQVWKDYAKHRNIQKIVGEIASVL